MKNNTRIILEKEDNRIRNKVKVEKKNLKSERNLRRI